MYFFIPNEKPNVSSEVVVMKRGAKDNYFLGLFTIFSAVNFHNILHLPPMLGMMFGLGPFRCLFFLFKNYLSMKKMMIQNLIFLEKFQELNGILYFFSLELF